MVLNGRIALFGEAEKGNFCTFCDNLVELEQELGNAPKESHGIHFAIQALMYHHRLIFFRVENEGYSIEDYFQGIQILNKDNLAQNVSALCIPGVGDPSVIDAMVNLSLLHSHILITREADLYDYLTAS